MKKVMFAVSYIVLAAGLAYAGTQYNWGTSNGASWVTPDDTTVQLGQALVVTSSVPYPTVGTSSNTAMGIMSKTTAQLKAYTPTFVGQIAYCSDCTNTILVVSTGTSIDSWAAVFQSTTLANGGVAIK